MENLEKNPNTKEQEFDFFLPDEENNEELVAAYEAANKNKPLDDNLSREIIDYVYKNINYIIHDQKIDRSLADMIPECHEIIEAMTAFKKNNQAINAKELFKFFKDYRQIKVKAKFKSPISEISDEKMDQIFKPLLEKGYSIEQAKLVIALEILAENIHKDVIKDMIGRNYLESKATKLAIKSQELDGEAIPYGHAIDFMNVFSEYIYMNKVPEIKAKDREGIKEISNVVSVIDEEFKIIDENKFEYEAMSVDKKSEIRKKLEEIKRAIENDPMKLFFVDNYQYLDSIIDKRYQEKYTKSKQAENDYKRIEKLLKKYSPL